MMVSSRSGGVTARVALAATVAIALSVVVSPAGAAAEKPKPPRLPAEKEVWLRADSPSFTVIGNVSAKKIVEIAETLERFRLTLLTLKPNASPISPVPTLFVAFTNDRSFDPYKTSPESRETKWVGSYQTTQFGNFFAVNAYPDQGNGMAVVYWGYAAHFIRSNYPTTPLWLRDGLAELYSTFRIENGVADVGRPSPENLERLRELVLLPLSEILTMTEASPGYRPENRAAFTAQSWMLAHYLLYGAPDGVARTADFLRRLDAGESETVAFQNAFGVEADKFEGRVRLYSTQRAFEFARVGLGNLPPAGVSTPRTLSRSETLTLLAGLPASTGRLDFAAAHVDAALAAAPENGDAWALAGWIAERRGDMAAAATAYRRALASGMERAASWMYVGAWQIRGQPDASESGTVPLAESAAAAKASAERALAIAPEFGEASALKGRAALALEQYPSAIVAFAEAQQRLPDRSDIVYNRIVAHVGAGQFVQARALVEGRLRRLADAAEVAQAREMVASRESSLAIDAAVEAANRAFAAGDLAGAIAAFTTAAAKTQQPQAKAYFEEQIASLERSKLQAETVDAFNAAVEMVNSGKLSAAKEALRALLVDCKMPEICARAEELVAEIERRSKGRR